MMSGLSRVLCVVGHGADKFTAETEAAARKAIRGFAEGYAPTLVISGASPVGGIDHWAIEEAQALGIPVREYPPEVLAWDGLDRTGFKQRNEAMAAAANLVHVVVVRELPPGYQGRRFPSCYHCRERNPVHVKSGGCWTAWKAHRRWWTFL